VGPTSRLRVAYLEAGAGPTTVVLLHANVVSSLIFQDFILALSPLGPYRVLAPDLRGFGASQVLSVDATRGLRDFADDLASWAEALQLASFHVLGWSMGSNVAVQYALDYPGRLRSLALEAPGSPFGYLGTKDAVGTPTWPDYAGSGGGTVHPDFLRNLAQQDRGSSPAAPRSVLGTYYLRPGFPLPPDWEDLYVDVFLSTALGPDNYPGDSEASLNCPQAAN
uniref:alpha/beta fold hydrolase n=1 Tax=Hymenobacter sp. TaxID=1898978 RepID=UPI00286A954F